MILIHQRHRQTDRQTDRRTTCNLNTALCTSASRGKKTLIFGNNMTDGKISIERRKVANSERQISVGLQRVLSSRIIIIIIRPILFRPLWFLSGLLSVLYTVILRRVCVVKLILFNVVCENSFFSSHHHRHLSGSSSSSRSVDVRTGSQ